ncbi:hypothetical protein LCGC14_2363640, partial [marine sediment metagenome]
MTITDEEYLDRALNIVGPSRTAKAVEPPGFLVSTTSQAKYHIPDGSLADNQLKTYQQLSWVTDAVGYVAKYAATVPLQVFARDGEGLNEVDNHPFEVLLQRPNEMQSRFKLLEATYANLMLAGNAYWHLNRSPMGEVLEVFVLPSDRMRPVPGPVVGLVGGYMWDAGNGQKVLVPPGNIIHFSEYHPRSMFIGMSRIESVSKEVAKDSHAASYELNFYAQDNAKPEGILGFKGHLDDDDWERFKQRFVDGYGGTQRRMAMYQGDAEVDYVQLALNHTDMDFLNSRNFTKEQVYNHFAPGLAAVLAVNTTEANARAGKNTLLEFGVWPMLVNVHEQITNKMMPLYDENLVAKFKDVRPVDRQLELSEQTMYAQTHTINEVRSKWYSDDPVGDERGELFIEQLKAKKAELDSDVVEKSKS